MANARIIVEIGERIKKLEELRRIVSDPYISAILEQLSTQTVPRKEVAPKEKSPTVQELRDKWESLPLNPARYDAIAVEEANAELVEKEVETVVLDKPLPNLNEKGAA